MASINLYLPVVQNPKTDVRNTYGIFSDASLGNNTQSYLYGNNFKLKSEETGSWEGNYFWDVYLHTGSNAETQFSIAFGTSNAIQLNTSDESYKYTYPSYAVYKQFYNLLSPICNGASWILDDTNRNFVLGGPTYPIDLAYFISFDRNRIKNKMDYTSFQLSLSGTLGNGFVAVSGSQSHSEYLTLTLFSGSTFGATSTDVGFLFPGNGMIVLDAKIINNNYIGTGSVVNGFKVADYSGSSMVSAYTPKTPIQNFYQLIVNGGYFSSKVSDTVSSNYYYCNISPDQFNYSVNPSWVGTDNAMIFGSDKKTFISGIGLYDELSQLVAVAKLSRPLEKDDTKQANITIRLDF